MGNRSESFLAFVGAFLIIVLAAVFAEAQTNVTPSRITRAIDPANLTILRGNTHPLAQARFDRGAAPSSLPMQRMLLVLKRSPEQETALDTLMEQQQDASSPNYHHWLAPQQFGQQFGPSDQDIQTVTSWLQSEGFQIDRVSNGRTVIEFSGTAAEVLSAFHTTIHQYLVNGESHWANSSDPAIPAALAPVVSGIDSLYNFPRHAMHLSARTFLEPRQGGASIAPTPNYTLTCGTNQSGQPVSCFAVGPYDFATIYNILPEWNATPAINGSGETIAIVGETDINKSDIEAYQKFFGLSVKDPTIVLDGPDPGIVPGDETESDLDVEVAGGVAPGATIDLVVSQTTDASLGVDLSAQYIVDNNLAPVLSESYGVCEFFLGTAGNQFYNQLWQQAAAQGITVVVSSGDAGSAVCDGNLGSQGPAQYGLSVSGFESTPYNVSVGGTDFNDVNNPSVYWTPTNNSTTAESARGYIPEMTWNNTCTNQEVFSLLGTSNAEQTCNDPVVTQNSNNSFLLDPVGGSGGKSGCTTSDFDSSTGSGALSSCAGGYAKPSWQTALTPNDSKRDVPDVSMFASNGFNGSFYMICEADVQPQNSFGSCGSSQLAGLGGTSAPTPAFAGIMALINQKTNSRWGNANYILYKLAGQTGNTCSSSSPTSGCVFYDIPSGSTIAMPCVTGSTADCLTKTSGDSIGVLSGYPTATGYDRATGLGSVNVTNLVNSWHAFALAQSSTTLTLNSGSAVNVTHGQPVNVSISVSPGSGAGGTPSGNVSLITNVEPNGQAGQDGVQAFPLTNGSASGTTSSLPGGTYTVFASYPGDGTFGSSNSTPPISVTVNPEASKVQLAYELLDPNTGAITNPNATTAVFGTPSILRVNVTSAAGDACATNAPASAGCPTGSVSLTDSYNGGAAVALDGGTFALNPQGYAEDQTIDLAGGTHLLAASYPGDNSYKAPSPNPALQTLMITPAPTTSTAESNYYQATVGTNVSLIATISSSGIFSSIGPSGTVAFYSGTTPVATAPVSGAVVGDQVNTVVTTTTTSLPHGQDSITAQYSGDSNYAASTSAPTSISVLYATTTALSSSSPTIQHGSTVTFTAQVSSSQGNSPPITGTILFAADSVALGSPVPISNGEAQISTSSLSGGFHTITAEYQGDSNYELSVGSTSETVNLISTSTAITSSNSTITQGSSVTLTATVTPGQTGGPAISGNVQFSYFSNNQSIGTGTISNGQAQVTTSTLTAGSDQIIARYSGDANYSASTSATFTETVNAAPTFTVTANPTMLNVSAPGQSGSTTLTVTSEGGFTSNGSVALTPMCSGLPSESSCTPSPSSINIAANGTATATLTIATTAPSALIPTGRNRREIGGWRWPASQTVTLAAILLMLCCAIVAGFRGAQRRWGLVFAMAALAFVFANVGCGGGGGGGGGTGPSNPGTPVGSNNITVSVTINGVTQTFPLTVNVQ